MARRKISYVDASKALAENRNRREQSRLEAVQKSINERENTRTLIENARDTRIKNERNHAMLMEAARNDNLSKALKAVYITALNPYSLTEMNLAYADGIVDNYINERGGATNILNGVKNNTYFLSRLTQIVEDSSKIDVHNIENFDRDLDKEFDMENTDPIPEKNNDVHNMQPEPKTDNGKGPKEGSVHNPYAKNPIKDFDPMDKFTKTNEATEPIMNNNNASKPVPPTTSNNNTPNTPNPKVNIVANNQNNPQNNKPNPKDPEDYDNIVKNNKNFVTEGVLDSIILSEEDKYRKDIAKKINSVCGQVLLDNGIECSLSPLYIGGNNAAFVRGQSRTWLMALNAKHHSIIVGGDTSGVASATTNSSNSNADRKVIEKIAKLVRDKKDEIAREIEDELGLEVDSIRVSHGKMGVTNLAVTLANTPGEDATTESMHPLAELRTLYEATGDEKYLQYMYSYYVENFDEFVITDNVVNEENVTIDSSDGAEIVISIKVNNGKSSNTEDEENVEEVEDDIEDGEANIEDDDSDQEDSTDPDLADADEEADEDDDHLQDAEDDDLEGTEGTEDGDVDDTNNDGEGDLDNVEPDNGENDDEESAGEAEETEFEDEESEAAEEEAPEEPEDAEEEDESEEDEVIGTDADGSNEDSDDTIENPGEEKGQLFKDLEKEPDIKKAIQIIRDRISDAEETFIKNNAEDKAKITQLIDKISDNVKTVQDAGENSKEGKIAQESAACLDRYRKDIQQGRPVMSIFEKITRKLNGSMLKNRQVLESYLDEDTGKLDEALIIESARVLYGWVETVNTLQLEKVDEAFIEDIIDQIK